ncbi:hypothetical protein AB0H73_10910 [Streptomyces olivoreticuli]
MGEHPDPLVVPIDVEALVVSEQVKEQAFYRAPLNFRKRRSDPQQEPFKRASQDLGVYVHWQLPDALMAARIQAKDGAAGTPVHPPVPNRWLVVRSFRPDSDRGGTPSVAGWVVESDYASNLQKTPDQQGGTSAFGIGRYIGRRHDLGAGPWKEDPGAERVRLTAVGPGIPEFAAYQPYNAGVLSLHDPAGTDGPTTLPNGLLDYLVVGWHTKPGDDPLHQKQATELLEFFYGSSDEPSVAWQQMSTPSERYAETLKLLQWHAPDDTVRQRSVYAGAVLGLRWGRETLPPSRRPANAMAVKIGVGHSPADATTALARDSVKEEGSGPDRWKGRNLDDAVLLMNAFQCGELEALDSDMSLGVRALDEAAHRTWFHGESGGYAWQAVPPVGADQDGPLPDEQQAMELLNQHQEELDRAERRSAALRQHLYDVWWMSGLKPSPKDFTAACTRELDPTNARGLARQARDAAAAADAAETAVGEMLRGSEKGRPPWLRPGWTLKRVPRPAFLEATDPVLLVHGAGADKEPAPATNPLLPCRLPRQLITEITVENASGAPRPIPEPPNFAGLRQALESPAVGIPFSVLRALLTEFSVITGTLAAFKTPPPKQAVDRDARALPAVMRERRATIPETSKWPTSMYLWEQPWRPLHLHWQADYYPQPHGKDHWKLDGVHHHQRPGTRKPVKLKNAQVQGRTLLASVPLFTWHKRVQDHHATYPGAPQDQLRALHGHVAQWDLLTQALDGLHAWCVQRGRGFSSDPLPEQKELKELLRIPNAAVPDPLANTDRFQPVCAGQLVLSRLAVTDRFGRGLDIIGSGDGWDPQRLRPRRSPGLTPSIPAGPGEGYPFIQQPPRLAQPARLCFDFLPHRSTDPTPALDPYTDPELTEDTPVCGWLLAHSEPHTAAPHSLLVHDPQGRGLGEVRIIGPANQPALQAVTWLPLPGSPWPNPADLFEPRFAAAYPHLARFLHALVDKNADERAGKSSPADRDKPRRFSELLTAVDRGLHTIAPPVADRDRTLCVLAGRPLALVRSRLNLELHGPPPDNPRRDDWKAALTRPRPGDGHPLWTSPWPVPLGAAWDRRDGLIGYYTTSGDLPPAIPDYNHLYVAHKPTKPAAWLKWIEDHPLTLLARGAPTTDKEDVDPLTAAFPTLLMDPFAAVAARTGILPTGSLRLPPALVSGVLSRLRIGISAGPVLLTTRPAPPEERDAAPPPVVLPAPTGWLGTWDWYERTDPAQWLPVPERQSHWTKRTLVAADALASHGDTPPVAASGYLTHTPPPLSTNGSKAPQENRP